MDMEEKMGFAFFVVDHEFIILMSRSNICFITADVTGFFFFFYLIK